MVEKPEDLLHIDVEASIKTPGGEITTLCRLMKGLLSSQIETNKLLRSLNGKVREPEKKKAKRVKKAQVSKSSKKKKTTNRLAKRVERKLQGSSRKKGDSK